MNEIENIIKEREGLIAAEKLGGNLVKEHFHRGVLMGITIAKSILSAQLEIDRWIKVAGENQKSANKSADWAEKAEVELTKLRVRLSLIEKVYSDTIESGQAEGYEVSNHHLWQAIKKAVEK